MFGTAEPIRMMFKYHNTNFNDHRINEQEWTHLKTSGFSEFDTLPVMEIDGCRLVEPFAVSKYIAHKFGYLPNTPMEMYMMDSICEFCCNINKMFMKMHEDRDIEGMRRCCTEKMPTFLRKIETRLERNNNGNGFFVGNSVTMADFYVFQMLWEYCTKPGKIEQCGTMCTTNAPKLMQWHQRMMNCQTFKNYLETRPQREC
ncbi:unnamed protein product [Blepharisma stoltei]|uniref:Glutathione S-transferase n=1 Tax=Blepharisma stoltei TaxID=1481888 RepID=A0AAU9K991_9CILI|nr:unnamed protein product [Blepharisma stoltei]